MPQSVHGIIFTADFRPDLRLDIAGLDLSRLPGALVRWGFDEELSGIVGVVVDARRVLGPSDLRSDAERGLWDQARGQPFAWATARLLPLSDVSLLLDVKALGWSGWGSVLEVRGEEIERSCAKGVAAQPYVSGGNYRVFPGWG